ncbi:cobalt-precorrin-6A reductase [Actinophytocola sp.]|uniref:cobalt-precorrin-6A reductase n=1 Tax=Actinophytocola sp. TaxID=1872138 RepID=UPI002D469498|nr:cobalt-precorrin-6A reductase [Actinophytocola sp.]HYQ65770.1 cobalt-precorrin-6A reductase [Actinophytocola sp.]
MTRSVVILGGTGEARELAAHLVDRQGVRVVSTLAGRVREPRLPVGEVRVGGFGGPERMADWLRAEGADVVVDATHPFAARISESAAVAAGLAGVPVLLLRRPGWSPGNGDHWRWADSLDEAAELLPGLGERVFLTTGRQGLSAFAGSPLWFLVRCVDAPTPPLPQRMRLLLSRGPYALDGELDLMRTHRIDVLVTKDSGGEHTVAKLHAARLLRKPVVIVRRPAVPDVPTVATVDHALSWLDTALG